MPDMKNEVKEGLTRIVFSDLVLFELADSEFKVG